MLKVSKTLNLDTNDLKCICNQTLAFHLKVGRHPNIVAMYGCCTEPNHQCMIMEYVPFGDLKHYLQNLRKQVYDAH